MSSQRVRAVVGLVGLTLVCLTSWMQGECAKDHRENNNAGILLTDFTITGTRAMSETDLAGITGELIGQCFDEDIEEMGERVRALFQDRGYFTVEVKSVRLKAGDPLGIPKPATMEAEVAEGLQYKLGEITFAGYRAFGSDELRQQFPLKIGAVFERGKVASGLESLRKLYGTGGYLDVTFIPETQFGSNATAHLNLTFKEGTQYRLDKVEFVGKKESTARLQVEWNLDQGAVYDASYLDRYIDANRDLLPEGFTRGDVEIGKDCVKGLVEVRLVVDAGADASRAPLKNVPCEDSHEKAK
jgi:outer membrane protein assembly factor BamA